METGIRLSEIVIGLAIFWVRADEFLVLLNRLFVGVLSFLLLTQSIVRQSQPKIGFGKIRIELGRLFEGLGGLLILVLLIKLLALVQANPGLDRIQRTRKTLVGG